MKQKFVYRRFKGHWEYLPCDKYRAVIENRLIQFFPRVEEEFNIPIICNNEEELWDKVTDRINELENISLDEEY